ncbi:MAG: formate--tetrahydrofolate ligase [Lentisphaeria bacterium]|nr:formate--tetrahydrofolate ligase [Lentisphaeria bacterium]
MLSDLDISQNAVKKHIFEIAASAGIDEKFVEPYGREKAKISLEFFNGRKPDAKLILVTAINPTKAGEGKTTCAIGLADSLAAIGKKTAIALREPSLGPVFGLKGGATGGGHAQVVPMEDINLHFTGDIHAITSANNLIAACIDNHIHFGNELRIEKVTFKRCMDISDRMLRDVTTRFKDEVREDSFNITVASEIMAVFCLADSIEDLRKRIGRIVVGINTAGVPVTVDDLGITGAVIVLLKDAVKPNLVQTVYHTPAFIHGGPFANIAHGCNSVLATKMAMCCADYVVTEAGFGADLGAEKFVDIKCRMAGLAPDAIVVVATLRALKMHGGMEKKDLSINSPDAVEKGFENLNTHIRHMRKNFGYSVPVRAALNLFPSDTGEEITAFSRLCKENEIGFDIVSSHRDGKQGAVSLAENIVREIAENAAAPKDAAAFPSYSLENGLEANIRTVCKKFYEAENIIFSDKARARLDELVRLGYDHVPVCMAKTPYALNDGSEDKNSMHIQDIALSAGAGFAVILTGDIMTMPGLPRSPMANVIDLADGKVVGMM